ncbi:hypothetical protein [Teichococcus deserti]|uniref:hypothetical protein n=1 Tax=Teichococcus deserti TaxID=1817963 RepID=UPI0010562892|nr:hypothetical protein [Pseudoroseomonas deserti]
MSDLKMNELPKATAELLQAAVVDVANVTRMAAEKAALSQQNELLEAALAETATVRKFVAEPSTILGSVATKHGEIAERVEVGVRRARDVFNQLPFSASIDNLSRTAPGDYILNNKQVQSKFINGVNNSLSAVLGHLAKYKTFGRDDSFYHVPKDQYAVMLKVCRGEHVDGLNAKTIAAISRNIREIEQAAGKPFCEAVKPSLSTYAEVQQGQVIKTISRHEDELVDDNDKRRDEISAQHQPGWMDGAKVVGKAAAIGATVGFATELLRKHREQKKNPFKGQFTRADWEEVGVKTLKDGAVGAVAGAALYGLTNFAKTSAPLANSFVAAAKALYPLVLAYKERKISLDQLLDQGTLVCSDVGIVGLCAVGSQVVIPVPVIGALVGSVAGKVLSHLLRSHVANAAGQIEQRNQAMIAELDEASAKLIHRIDGEFDRLGDLVHAAFDLSLNESLTVRSVEFALALGVPSEKLLRTDQDLIDFLSA